MKRLSRLIIVFAFLFYVSLVCNQLKADTFSYELDQLLGLYTVNSHIFNPAISKTAFFTFPNQVERVDAYEINLSVAACALLH
jgi:hypothetical protein